MKHDNSRLPMVIKAHSKDVVVALAAMGWSKGQILAHICLRLTAAEWEAMKGDIRATISRTEHLSDLPSLKDSFCGLRIVVDEDPRGEDLCPFCQGPLGVSCDEWLPGTTPAIQWTVWCPSCRVSATFDHPQGAIALLGCDTSEGDAMGVILDNLGRGVQEQRDEAIIRGETPNHPIDGELLRVQADLVPKESGKVTKQTEDHDEDLKVPEGMFPYWNNPPWSERDEPWVWSCPGCSITLDDCGVREKPTDEHLNEKGEWWPKYSEWFLKDGKWFHTHGIGYYEGVPVPIVRKPKGTHDDKDKS